jgi:4-amino-4-deoxy-L-arabinose transferase-like glycosyltransferase
MIKKLKADKAMKTRSLKEDSNKDRHSQLNLIFLAFIMMLSLGLNLWNNNFPLYYHADEAKKVFFIQHATQDFKHPIFMLQIVSLFKEIFGDSDIILLGRRLSAVFGTLIVLLSYLISKRTLGPKYALFVSLATALSPIMVIHAHYLKEDVFATCFMLLSIYLLLELIRQENKYNVIFFGIATGLACSAQYKAFLLLALYLFCPFIVPSLINEKKKFFHKLFLVYLITLITFCVVNWPIFLDPSVFINGLYYETNHIIEGHDVNFYAIPHFFSFHLFNSIIPGITLPLTLLALAGIFFALIKWKSALWQDKILIAYGALIYFTAEFSPNKPFPDFMRYMIPVTPVLLYFACALMQKIESSIHSSKRLCITCFMVLALMPSVYDTALLDYYLVRDTRGKLEVWLAASGEKVICEKYAKTRTTLSQEDISLAEVDLEKAEQHHFNYLVASSFYYDRILRGGLLDGQPQEVYQAYNRYQRLFKLPFVEIKPAFKSFAFSNPTIRIIKLGH